MNYKSGKYFVENVSASILAKKFGTPLYCYSKAILDKNLISKCDRLENVIGSGKVHGRKFFQKGISRISKIFGEINTHVDIGCGDGQYLSLLNNKVKNKQLMAYKHIGFWACMDTMREKKELNKIWKSKQKAWKIWI